MMKKRILASLLSLCLLVGLLPTVALATGEGGTDGVQDSGTTPVIVTPTGDSGTETEAVEPDTSWYTEAGTDATSYTISDVADLLGLAEITQNAAKAEETRTGDPADNFADKTVTLAADLNLENVPWFVQNDNETEPSVDHRIVGFAGTFGGGDHTISNLSFVSNYVDTAETEDTEPDRNDLGLFQSVTGAGTVENLTLDTVTASLSDYDQFAPLAHRFLGTAENCHVKNVTVTGTATEGAYIYAAGMVLFCEPEETGGTGESVSLTSCTVTGLKVKVEGAFDTGGGLVGQFGGSTALTVEDCSAKEIHFEADSLRWVFGLLGYAVPTEEDVTIIVSSCLVSGVSFKAESITTAGGFSLTGSHKNEAAFTFTDCHVEDASFECGTGEMGWVGGFTSGTNIRNTFESCTVDGVVFRKESSDSPCYQVGGFSGNTQNTLTEADKDEACKFDNCHVTGLDMQVAGPATHESAYSGAYLSIGGFIGTASQGWAAIENCSVTGTIDSPSYAGEIGGFIGGLGWNANQTISVKDCEANVNVTAGGDAGGFIGRSADQSAEGQEDIAITLIVEDCIAKGSVTSLEGAAGGFVGAGDRGTYTNCKAEGTFVSGVKAGGFWGEIFPLKDSDSGFTVSITGCKAYNSVQGSGHAAGFLGDADTTDGSKTTSVTINSSAASPAVTGTASGTVVSCFLNLSDETTDEDNISQGTGDDANTRSITIGKPNADSGGTVGLDEKNGDMAIQTAAAKATRCREEGKTVALPVGSVIHRDGSITIPADEDNPYGSTIDPEGTQRTHGVLTVSPDSNTVYSNAGTTSFTYTYNGDGAVTAESSNSNVATASVSGNNTVTVTILKAGNANITVSAPQTEKYTAAEDVYALTVRQYTSSGGSSSGTTTYPITVEDSRNGEVDSNRTRASSGATVTLTVTPEEGYELDELIVTDKNGDVVKLTDKGDGKYTFTMPRSAVTVEATFRAVEPATPAWDECGRGPDCPAYHFTDLNLSLWYHDGIHFCVEHGLMNGTSATTFEPDTTTSRGMIVTILYRLEGTPAVGASSFTDVAAGAYYADAVAWANANGIVMGYGNGKYGPDDPVTREQLAAILYRYAQYKGYDTTQSGMSIREFSDYAQISDYALEPMAWAVNAGLINGITTTTLAPTGSGTRAQTAALLMRFCENIAK